MEIPTSTRSRILAPGKAQEDSTNRQTHFMQRKIIMIMAGAAVSCSIAHAEVDILSCVRKEVDVPSGVVSPLPPDRKTIGLTVYHVGETLGKAQLDDDRLSDLVSAALSEDQSEDPFFGPGYEYILRDAKGRHYIVFFEFMKGNKSFPGSRAAIAPMIDHSAKGAVFVGYAHDGVTANKKLLDALMAVTEKRPAENAGAGQPATHPESKSKGGDKPQTKSEGGSR